jgi:hypothetical protein
MSSISGYNQWMREATGPTGPRLRPPGPNGGHIWSLVTSSEQQTQLTPFCHWNFIGSITSPIAGPTGMKYDQSLYIIALLLENWDSAT